MTTDTRLMTRAEWATEVCRRVSRTLAAEIPPALGWWAPARQMVEEPSGRLLDALARFEETGNATDREEALRLARLVIQRWRAAASEWQARGRPESRETVT